jgi:hypothetical protein
MENKLNLSVILPIKSAVTKDFADYFEKAIKSLQIQNKKCDELVIVHTKEEQLVKHLTEFDFGDLNVKLVDYDGEPSYQNQVKLGVEKSIYEWVSFFEFDDEYSNIWFENVNKYINHYPDIEVFLPIVVDVDNKGVFAGFTNEATFAANFTQEIGYLTNETLLDYQNFQTAGMVIKKSILESFGLFKPSIKLTFVYELLLRLTYNSVRIMTIPKLGYKHLNLREGSIFWNYKFGEEKMLEDEVRFWIETAKKEYFFKDDRSIKYELQKN